jgi:hypothetical protein
MLMRRHVKVDSGSAEKPENHCDRGYLNDIAGQGAPPVSRDAIVAETKDGNPKQPMRCCDRTQIKKRADIRTLSPYSCINALE